MLVRQGSGWHRPQLVRTRRLHAVREYIEGHDLNFMPGAARMHIHNNAYMRGVLGHVPAARPAHLRMFGVHRHPLLQDSRIESNYSVMTARDDALQGIDLQAGNP